MHLQGLNVQADHHIFPLEGEDLLLGMDWLEKLGDIKANFRNMILKVKQDGKVPCLKGVLPYPKRRY